jgi:hypothetical protein
LEGGVGGSGDVLIAMWFNDRRLEIAATDWVWQVAPLLNRIGAQL